MTWQATSVGPYCKDLSSGQDVAGLKYVCTVTEYKLKRDKSKEKSGGGKDGGGSDKDKSGGKGAEVSDEERCQQLTTWLGKYNKDKEEGKARFWKWLAKNHPSFESLEKLKEHSLNAGTGSGKVRAAIESKATKTYKGLTREIHPDKLAGFFRKTPKCDKQEVKDMLREVFDRATALKNCVLKPLRCDVKTGAKGGGGPGMQGWGHDDL